ncbi:MAG: hypothetical protein HKN23_11830 [Verrucomicrobiales bacterium]|nr:hypothetical protein [Verrucomicrobiales bacterium]
MKLSCPATIAGLFCLCGLLSASDGSTGKKSAQEPVGHLNQPLALTLDLQSFNPEEEGGGIGRILFHFQEWLEHQGISQEGTVSDLHKLHALIQQDYDHAEEMEDDLDDEYDDLKDEWEDLEEDIEDEKDDADLPGYLALKARGAPLKAKRNLLRDYLALEKPLLKKLEAARSNPSNDRQRKEACDAAIRILYSLFSGQFMDERDDEPLPLTLGPVVGQFLDRAHRNASPFMGVTARYRRPVGKLRAKNQASDLVDPNCLSRFVTPEEMAIMTHAEVAALDVSPWDPMWHTRRRMETNPPDTWSMIEEWIEKEVTEELMDDDDFKEDHPDFEYSLHDARRVLFWDDVKSTATSPKVDVIDIFEQEWKLKWGEETATEPMGNRLRLALGAKYSDLTYANVDGTSHVLILASELDKKLNPDDEKPTTVKAFIRVMKESKYDFNVKPFILASGTITEENADTILAHVPEEAPKKHKKKRLMGRTWIKFKESMVENKHDVVNRGGPISLHTEFSKSDRALRQALVFGIWMEDTDVKEDNHRTAWAKDFGGHDGQQYFEFFHDPGSSLGGERQSGEVNKLHVETGTGGFMWISPGGNVVLSNSFQLYRPAAWFDLEFADYLAGAEHIVRLKKSQIREVIESSLMPDFYNECMTWRLAKRRDIMAGIFSLPLPDAGAGDAPNFSVPLTTRADRRAAAAHYRIPLSEIEADLVRTGFLPAANCAADTSEPFFDRIVIDGVIQSYEDSVIPGILRDVRYPSGFTDRITRWSDGEDYISRRYRKPYDKPKMKLPTI